VATLNRGAATFEMLDNSYDAGWFTAMALDGAGLPVITYVQGAYPEGDLKVTRKMPSGEWKTETIDDTSVKSSLAIDAQGFIHVAYTKVDEMYMKTKDLFYATNAPDGKWTQEKLDGGQFEKANTGFFPSLLIDHLGTLHIIYNDDFHERVWYARNFRDGKGWQITSVTKNHDDGYYASLAEDPAGVLHFVYDDGSQIKHAACGNCTIR
jgi:hypothetical protein